MRETARMTRKIMPHILKRYISRT